ncbi:glycosyltransferase [Solwaraspora sp. WMMD1047]|uniref:glycosyltransferase n=1 Tax=Solwaraspora sp. WMMD1047 TaxID=3016102 RepID=UPI0024180C4F|nr:glycosyltransferase [Solwaraspora sp. WMMD1047]MDG4830108.1 glycosyltransferase [Solwaraspora sp. WMMD1047]
MRIVRLANFVTGNSGGLRTALRELGAGYRAAGHEPVLIVPGAQPDWRDTEQGLVVTLPGPVVPGTGGYRVLLDRKRLRRVLDGLAPDRIEVSDRTTLRWTGRWASRHGVPSVMVSHETLAGLLRLPAGGRLPVDRLADRMNVATAGGYDRVVCTTAWAAAEFHRVGAANVVRVPLGVDLDHFRPDRYDQALRDRYAARRELLLLHCARLSPEKKPERVLAALAELRDRAVPAVLVVVGSGPRQARMRAEARRAGLPVRFENHVSDRVLIARLLATADVVLAPGPVETFGLAALEALASGTPVVASAESALPEVIGTAGVAVPGDGPAYADAVVDLASRSIGERRAAARRRAEDFPWSASVDGFLAAHGLPATTAVPADRSYP